MIHKLLHWESIYFMLLYVQQFPLCGKKVDILIINISLLCEFAFTASWVRFSDFSVKLSNRAQG